MLHAEIEARNSRGTMWCFEENISHGCGLALQPGAPRLPGRLLVVEYGLAHSPDVY